MSFRTLLRFTALFGGRTDAYFESMGKGGRAVRAQVTCRTFADHLAGAMQIGTYPVIDAAMCRWGCIDIDMADNDARAYELADDVKSAWTFFGVHTWIERSRSKGYHVWCFAEDWVPAGVMRDAGRWVAKLAELDPKTEINPKNAAPWLTTNGLVNTVRTPYPGDAPPGRMAVIDEHATPIPLEDFVNAAYTARAKHDVLSRLSASMRQVDRAQRARAEAEASASSALPVVGLRRFTQQPAALILNGQARAQLGERDNQFFTMAKLLHASNTPYAVAEHAITRRWRETDTTDFPLAQALAKLQRVYGLR